MQIKDLPENTSVSDIRVRIPETFEHECRLSGLNSYEVYIVSMWHMGVWVKINRDDERMYPITNVMNLEDWEVIK